MVKSPIGASLTDGVSFRRGGGGGSSRPAKAQSNPVRRYSVHNRRVRGKQSPCFGFYFVKQTDAQEVTFLRLSLNQINRKAKQAPSGQESSTHL